METNNNKNNNALDFDKILEEITLIRKDDPIKAIYKVDEYLKNAVLSDDIADLESLRQNIIFQIKKDNLIVKTNLDTLSLINSLKNKKMDYVFMLNYNELKGRDDFHKHAAEFQHFFNQSDFDSGGFQTLIYDLLQNKEIDFDYLVNGQIINPKKLGSFLENPGISKMQSEIFATFDKDVAKNKVARQVFSAYLFKNWVDILLKKTTHDYEQIINVVNVLYGEKDENELNNEEKAIYQIFSK
ncbi:hypothetical protein DA803_01585 [[Mycoplasma] phocae]|uniref:Uncharacterized protein n=1 Tax=[Mycoplasma] phocae TaxID=142651 RepID=A0A2Z5IQD3_9BACT|nr:hypothetical protein [[Mycoplasma] phocae]AXE60777.1 hypothetical protein DA803_01585 [[Mycoplasma] phocae]